MPPATLGTRTPDPVPPTEEDPMSSSDQNSPETPDTQADPQTHLDTDPVNAPNPETDLAGNPVEDTTDGATDA